MSEEDNYDRAVTISTSSVTVSIMSNHKRDTITALSKKATELIDKYRG